MRNQFRTLLLLVTLAVLSMSVFAQDEPLEVGEDDLKFTVDPSLAQSVAVAKIATEPLNADTPPGDENPAHTLFTFIGYDLGELAPNIAATLAVYDVAEFEAAGYTEELSNLRMVLDQRPDLTEQTTLPYLPQIAPVQTFVARPAYVKFAGGTGVRYLTYFSFDVSPVLEGNILYTFQGLTADETRYIAATFPLDTGLLDAEFPEDFDLAAFENSYDTYMADLLADLNTQDAASFTPNLDTLDELIASITVGDADNSDVGVVTSTETTDQAAATPAAEVASAATSTPAVQPTFTVVPTLSPFFTVEQSRFKFNVEYLLASDWEYRVVPGAANNPGTPPGDEYPSFVEFTLPSYRYPGSYPATIRFYLIQQDPALFGFDAVVVQLQTLLRDKPDLATQQQLPFPPIFDATQGIQGRPEYLDFPSGTGIRYLTIYVQEDKPPVEGSVFYTYLGITADERYLVSVMMPVDTGLLQPEIQNFDINNFNTSAEGFYTDLEDALKADGSATITPSIAMLDNLVSSITVALEE